MIYPHFFKHLFQVTVIVLFLLMSSCQRATADGWHTLSMGILYQDLGHSLIRPFTHIHAFKIDLSKNHLESITAKELKKENASSLEFGQYRHALIAINGGFFGEDYKPLGLRISDKEQKSPIKPISWWGVFYTQQNKPFIKSVRAFKKFKDINFAIQSGPRLIVDGTIMKLKPGLAERTALGITQDNKVIILATENSPLTTQELAQLLQSKPLSCVHALNLDGGSSTQIYADIGHFKLNVHGFSNVSDAVLVLAND